MNQSGDLGSQTVLGFRQESEADDVVMIFDEARKDLKSIDANIFLGLDGNQMHNDVQMVKDEAGKDLELMAVEDYMKMYSVKDQLSGFPLSTVISNDKTIFLKLDLNSKNGEFVYMST
ncbi:hypothetical protein L1887_05142 [Cichorium endivia]|nr:hypothetical protein L1887_05142 [Cichorium endivia]